MHCKFLSVEPSPYLSDVAAIYAIKFALCLATSTLLMSAGLGAAAQTNFGAVNIGASSTATVTVSIPIAGTVVGIAVLTQGAPNLDFTIAGGGTCAIGTTYAASAACTVNVAFAPRHPGSIYGAVVLESSNGVVATAYLLGRGLGPMVDFLPVNQSLQI